MANDYPDFRVTLAGRAVRLVDWGPWLADGGPLQTLLHARGRAGVAIADLTVIRDDDAEGEDPSAELVVRFMAGDRPEARGALAGWAASVGYKRVWMPGEVLDLEPSVGGVARTRCTGCRVVLQDGQSEFWLRVRRSGRFPTLCPLCGSDLPQWETDG